MKAWQQRSHDSLSPLLRVITTVATLSPREKGTFNFSAAEK